jgi:hypothetical protein
MGTNYEHLTAEERATLMVMRADGLAWISQTYGCIGAENLRKLLCCNNFSQVQEHPDADRVYVGAV